MAFGAIAVAFAFNSLNGQIDDNDELLSTLNTDVLSLTDDMDALGEDQGNICTKVKIGTKYKL